MKTLEITPSTEWVVYLGEKFHILVRHWNKSVSVHDYNNWNVYVVIYEKHPLFNDPSRVRNLPFHGGCTYDKYITSEYSEGCVYEWQKPSKVLKVGCDYQHIYSGMEGYHARDGIPGTILHDVQELIQYLENIEIALAM